MVEEYKVGPLTIINNTVIRCDENYEGEVVIPDGVTSISDWAFIHCTSLTNVAIPDSVTNIGDYAFSDCTSLEKIEVNAKNSVYSSVDGVLFNKEQTELIRYPAGKESTSYDIPNGVTSVADTAFAGCSSLMSIIIPDSVESIGNEAFYNCTSLKSIMIPDSVIDLVMSVAVLSGCTSLENIEVDAKNPKCSSINGVLFNKRQTELVYYPAGKPNTSYTIPEGVTSIIGDAFKNCVSLKSITVPDSVTQIGYGTFENCDKDLTFRCSSTSYAAKYAEIYGINIEYTDKDLTYMPINSSVINLDEDECHPPEEGFTTDIKREDKDKDNASID